MPSIALRQASPLRKLLVCMQTLLRAGHDVKFRGSYAPCRSAESRIFSRLPSPAIAVSTTLLGFARLADARAAGGMGEYAESPRSALCRRRFSKQNSHRDGGTALHWAALHGNRRIVRILIGANADVDAQDNGR